MKNLLRNPRNQHGAMLVAELILLALVLAAAGYVGLRSLSVKSQTVLPVTRPTTVPPNPAPVHTPSPAPTPTPAPAPVPPGSPVATDADNGKTFTLGKLQSLTVRLSSTYWTIHEASDTSIIHMVGQPVYMSKASECVPGGGCGTVTATFSPGAPGTATISASRTSCGEAMACTSNSSKYQITVITPALK